MLTFFFLADIRITRHPLLGGIATEEELPSQDFYEQSLLENELDYEPSFDTMNAQRLASIKRKEALLRKKKELLRELIKKLRELIIQSNQLTGNTDSNGDGVVDQATSPQRLVPQIKPVASSKLPRETGAYLDSMNPYYEDENDGPKVKPWWERIMSNRHKRTNFR